MKKRRIIGVGAVLALWGAAHLAQAGDDNNWQHGGASGPPSVQIVTPQPGETFLIGEGIGICAQSLNFTDIVARIEFLAGTNVVGVVTNECVSKRDGRDEFRDKSACVIWSNAPAGLFTLTALATDQGGNTVTSAPVDISVVTNIPPLVTIVHPHDGAYRLGPTNVTICASAYDQGGTVSTVAFFEDTNLLGIVTNTPFYVTNRHGVFECSETSYCLTWSNAAVGDYTLTAVATDNGGVSTTSAPVALYIVTNIPPRVKIVQPDDGSSFFAPASISICAEARDRDGSVSNVEFFAGSASLGTVTNGTSVTNHHGEVVTTYCLTWTNVPISAYALTAVATDNGGVSSASTVVNVSVVAPPPPRVKIVSPANGAAFHAPANIEIDATTRYFTNHIASVQFFANSAVIGVVTNSPWPTFHWKSVGPGSYTLDAIATDTGGVMATSAPVSITVTTNSPDHGHGNEKH